MTNKDILETQIMKAAESLGESTIEHIRKILIQHDAGIIEGTFEAMQRVIKAEREACAQLCEDMGMEDFGTLAIAAAIRARTPKEKP